MTQLLSVCCFNSALRDVSACSSLWPLPVRNELSEAHRRDWMIRWWEVIPLWVRHDCECGIWCSVFSHFLVTWIRSSRSRSTDSFVPESVTAVHLCNSVSYFLFVLLDKRQSSTTQSVVTESARSGFMARTCVPQCCWSLMFCQNQVKEGQYLLTLNYDCRRSSSNWLQSKKHG